MTNSVSVPGSGTVAFVARFAEYVLSEFTVELFNAKLPVRPPPGMKKVVPSETLTTPAPGPGVNTQSLVPTPETPGPGSTVRSKSTEAVLEVVCVPDEFTAASMKPNVDRPQSDNVAHFNGERIDLHCARSGRSFAYPACWGSCFVAWWLS